MGFLSKIFGIIGGIGSSAPQVACTILFFDEPECPKSIIEK